MKLHFEPQLDYQLQAVDAVCGLFRGQEVCRTEFTVTRAAVGRMENVFESGLGIGNRLTLLDDELMKNLHEVQLHNGLAPSVDLGAGDFTVEMETGTGKTYVYLRTIFELNLRFGFTKFVIVVPSIAIKEGVYKSLQITEEHFKGLYAGVHYEYFLYDSSKLGQVRNFATSPHIQIMVVTVGAINKKDVNNLYKESEKTGGEKPIDLIRATRPVLIVDEPQSVDGGLEGRGKEALGAMSPMCTLRYSATHADKHAMVYRLDAVDAYERKLVKQIEVAAATVEDAYNKPYVRLVRVDARKGEIRARVELDVQKKSSVQRMEVTLQAGDDLEQTTGRALYANYRVGELRAAKGKEFMELNCPGKDVFLRPGEVEGDVDDLAVHRQMIRRTIREHLEKEKRLRPQGIKVLSLFFIDQVSRYRQYDEQGQAVAGVYATIFEEEYLRAARHPDFASLFGEVDQTHVARDVHDGYFSIDRKGGWSDTTESNQTNRENAERAYNLIMKDKERLLDLNTPLKFIFSHSALREGWDSPNVFQICALRDMRSERERRQTIGRGLRLCVNQEGQRVRGFEINTLTVVARESYERFAENLQKEIEQDTGIRFGVVEKDQFAALPVTGSDGVTTALGREPSGQLWEFLLAEGFIDAQGRVTDKLRQVLASGRLQLPERFLASREPITAMLKKLAGRLDVKNADERRRVQPRQAVLQSQEFKELWDRIKFKTTYRLDFDNEQLIEACALAIENAPAIARVNMQWRKADLTIGRAGVTPTHLNADTTVHLEEGGLELPDILTEMQNRTQLTRRTLCRILQRCSRLGDFKRNPQKFIELAVEVIARCKRSAIVDGIRYQRIGDASYYAQELFEQEELSGYLRNLLVTKKSATEEIVYDSQVEADFARGLESNTAVRVYAKLPGWFSIPTPLGGYNPDWAVLVETENQQRLYFVVETKGSLFVEDLRQQEQGKIACGRAHFHALEAHEGSAARYVVASTVEDLLART
ncbi:MAG: restriction endonuclease subunit R [Deltaproteobacteria bacterium HGW-Deltaproteobacteria-22]|jgi:type III restriction enzyme|nr:MAG: restriction endonuclease subunit R [Deltaproteobacteria bacterium HGW-Deltaproteobacteria-22]